MDGFLMEAADENVCVRMYVPYLPAQPIKLQLRAQVLLKKLSHEIKKYLKKPHYQKETKKTHDVGLSTINRYQLPKRHTRKYIFMRKTWTEFNEKKQNKKKKKKTGDGVGAGGEKKTER